MIWCDDPRGLSKELTYDRFMWMELHYWRIGVFGITSKLIDMTY